MSAFSDIQIEQHNGKQPALAIYQGFLRDRINEATDILAHELSATGSVYWLRYDRIRGKRDAYQDALHLSEMLIESTCTECGDNYPANFIGLCPFCEHERACQHEPDRKTT